MLDQDAIAGRIRFLRGDLSQKEFAGKLGYKQAYISEIETLKTKASVDFLYAVSEKYNVTIDWILKGNRESLNSSPVPVVPMVPVHRVKEAFREAEETLFNSTIRLDEVSSL